MTVGSTKWSKSPLALQIAGGLALACLDRAMPVGVLGVGEGELRIEPSLARDRVLEWLHRLRRFRYDEATLFGERVAQVGAPLNSRPLLVGLPDPPGEAAPPAFRLFAPPHHLLAPPLPLPS